MLRGQYICNVDVLCCVLSDISVGWIVFGRVPAQQRLPGDSKLGLFYKLVTLLAVMKINAKLKKMHIVLICKFIMVVYSMLWLFIWRAMERCW